MSEKATPRQKRDWRLVQRQRRFRSFYLETGNAYESAIAAGYSPVTAKTHAWRMAAAAEETLRDQCDLIGLTKLSLVLALKRALTAKEPKWNAKSEKWDLFENASVQLAAYDRLKEIIEPEVPKAKLENLKIGVAVAAGAADPAAWMERNKDKIPSIKTAVTVTIERSESAGNGAHGNGGGGV